MIQKAIFYSVLCHCAFATSRRHDSKLLVVSFDGFRYDFLDRGLTPNLISLKTRGTYAKFMRNVFPTETYPNHFSIATGLYPETHGVIANQVYNKTTKALMDYGYPLFHYNEDIVPIWTLNERAGDGRHSGVMMWPGGDLEYGGLNATFIEPYNKSFDWRERVDTVIGWLGHPETPANLVMMYFEQPDEEEHVYGPESPQVDAQIKRTDDIAKYLLENLDNYNMSDVNVVILSDHGMNEIKVEGIVNLTSLTNYKFEAYGTSPVLQIYPSHEGDIDGLYNELKHEAKRLKTYDVYRKTEIPDYFHYKHCGRTPPILAVAEPGSAFEELYDRIQLRKKYYNVTDEDTFGTHGYDPNVLNMQSFFLSKGPIFKQNYTVNRTIDNINLYSLFAYALDLELPSLKPNGSFADIVEVVRLTKKGA